jgi:hypothetical protein
MVNDANGLVSDITGTNPIESLIGVKAAAVNSTINSIIGLAQFFKDAPQSIKVHGQLGVGFLGDVKDLITETPKIFSNKKP